MYDTIVIGAGQAGLAAAIYLKKFKHNFLIIQGVGFDAEFIIKHLNEITVQRSEIED